MKFKHRSKNLAKSLGYKQHELESLSDFSINSFRKYNTISEMLEDVYNSTYNNDDKFTCAYMVGMLMGVMIAKGKKKP